MFALKISLAILIFFFVMYNGASILVQEKPLMRRMVEFSLYIIILSIIGSFVFNIFTYYQIKYKKGTIGDPGIRGQKGPSGDKGKCESNCGIKVCVLDLISTANKTFYTELERIYGGVMLQYDIPKNKKIDTKKITNFIWNKIYDNHRILVILPENRAEFMTESEENKRKIVESILSVYVTRNSNNTRLYVRIHGGKSLGEKLRKQIIKDKKYFGFNDILPSVVSKEDEMDAVNKCLMESVGKKIVIKKNEDGDENGELELQSCNDKELEGLTPELNDIQLEEEEKEEVMDVPKKKLMKLKIRNQFFINKIRSICNSPEYQETLEIELKNKPNEKKLIEFLSETIVKWIRTLMTFTYIKEENNELSYGGMRFLLTRESDINVFHKYLDSENYRNSFSKTELVKMNPIYELKKYDIWNWNQPYTNVPLIFEKCDRFEEPPIGREPILSVIKTNNYEKVYDSRVKKSKWYSTDTYCPFNQLGEFNENPENKKECVFYDTNSQGHDYLEGRQPAWKAIEFTQPKSLGLYHPKSIPKNQLEEPDIKIKNKVKNEYFKDDNGRYYYPLGSVWSGNILGDERPDANEFNPKSKESNTGNLGNGPEKNTILVTGDVVDPVDYQKVWNSKGDGKGCTDCQDDEATIWKPIPPEGYICLGDVVVAGNEKPDIANEALIKCVPEKCVAKIPIKTKVWDAELLTKKIFAEDATTMESAIHPIHKFFLILNDRFNAIDYGDISSVKIAKGDLYSIIDDLIKEEEKRANSSKVNNNYLNPYSSTLNIKKLKAFKTSDFVQKYPIKSLSTVQDLFHNKKRNLYSIHKQINYTTKKILENYQQRFESLKDLGFSDTKTTNFDSNDKLNVKFDSKTQLRLSVSETKNLGPIVQGSNPVNIYSAGSTESKVENYYRPDLKIRDDGGHNLFLADNEKTVTKPEFAYKLKKQCFQSIKGTPPESNKVAGTLTYLDRKDEQRKSAMHYFTYPLNIIITCKVGGARSHNGNPKKYYLTFAKEILDKSTDIKTPVYVIKVLNDKTKKFSKCIGIYDDDTLVESDIDINFKGNLWIPINIDSSKKNFTPLGKESVTINLVSYTDNSKYFSHSYNHLGKGEISISNDKNSPNALWNSQLVRD